MNRKLLTVLLLLVILGGLAFLFRDTLPPLFTSASSGEDKEIADNKPDLYERNQQRLNWQSQQGGGQNRYYYGNQGYQNYQYGGGQSGNQVYYYYNNGNYNQQGSAPRMLQSPPPN